jgi:hypothetical protein
MVLRAFHWQNAGNAMVYVNLASCIIYSAVDRQGSLNLARCIIYRAVDRQGSLNLARCIIYRAVDRQDSQETALPCVNAGLHLGGV